MTELTDLSETDASNTTITGANIAEGCNPSEINNAIRNALGLIRRAFKTSIFRLRDSTDQTKLLAFDLSEFATAATTTLKLPNITGGSISTVPRGHIYGLALTNGTDAVNDIDIAAGEAASSDTAPVLMTLASALTKRLDAAWAVGSGNGGLDTGAVGNSTYYIWLIQRSDTGVVDALYSLSATAPTMPASYDRKRLIGVVVRASAANGLPTAYAQPDTQLTGVAPVFGCRAWVNFNGTTAAISGSGNIASVVRNSVGNYTITFTTAMPDANYAICAAIATVGSPSGVCLIISQSTTGFVIGTSGVAGGTSTAGDPAIATLSVFR